MQDRTEYLLVQLAEVVEFVNRRRDVCAMATLRRYRRIKQRCLRLAHHARLMRFKAFKGVLVDHGADIGCIVDRVANLETRRGARDHLYHRVGDIILHQQDAGGRAALAC